MSTSPAPGPQAKDTTVDLLVIGSGTGLSAALAAAELGLGVLVVEKTPWVGGSTARSGGAFWIPANPALLADGAVDTVERGEEYLAAVVGDTAPASRWRAFAEHGPATVEMLDRTTPLEFFWARGYSDYHPENPGGAASGRTCESRPFDLSTLGPDRSRMRPGVLEAPVPMPVTGADYKWMNLMTRTPLRAVPRIVKRAAQGIGGKVVGREYVAGGQAIAAGLFAGVRRVGIPVWTDTAVRELVVKDGRVIGALVEQRGRTVTVTARRGVILAAGGFDHDMAMRHEYQSPTLVDQASLGAEGNTGDAIRLAQGLGAGLGLMDQSWWFPAVAPVPGGTPQVLLAERSLPGSLMVDASGRRFVNEATDYMSFGQKVLARERAGDPVGLMWLVFDQRYRNDYVFAGTVFPRMSLPRAWYDAGIAHKASDVASLARATGLPTPTLTETMTRFDVLAAAGIDDDFHRGGSAYDRYYGDPTVTPNPNLRPMSGPFYAVEVVLSDLGTCGGLTADEHARVLRVDGSPIEGLYAVGNTAANAFGATYPGAGATIGQGLVFGYLAARHLARAAA